MSDTITIHGKNDRNDSEAGSALVVREDARGTRVTKMTTAMPAKATEQKTSALVVKGLAAAANQE